ncbi:pectinesterase family protein [Candidatus Nitronereus thalassa]|uniref:Pectinesterase family protein n=1 Tax=Candidatus Nitronereus thalassa TaxID=3020898 RepID=A0ABU3K3W2_9BACT|nr:pectinesterase family protein [Candidatus Nitronereus thalassa]MDT7041066.1 pectinesterase family protein [Candidatus Nitronereus thalassa]
MKFLSTTIIILGCLLCGASLVTAQEGFLPHGSETPGGATWVVALDGTGQFISIQEAIDQAHNGDTIFIKAGNYSEDVTVHSKEGLKIVGEGWKKVFIAGLNRVGTLHIGKWPYGATDVEISGMSIQQHGGLGIGIFNGAGVMLRDIHVNGLIFVQQVQRVRIEHCIVGGSETTGMAFADSDAILVGNIIHDNDHGVSVGGTSKVEMKNNVITRSLFEAILVADKGQASIVQNTLVNNGGGVKFQDESFGDIRGNIISDSKVGVAYSSTANVTRSYNAFHNNGAHDQISETAPTSSSGNSQHNALYVSPHFVAPDRGDFRLQTDSPLLNVGEFPFLGALGPISQ